MRRRRAQRCLLRAEVAIEAGFLEDAHVALDEARRLDAPAEEIARIEALIPRAEDPVPAAAEPAVAAESRRLGWKPLAAAALIAIAASIFGAGALWRDTPSGVPIAQATPTAPAAAPAPAPGRTVQNVPVRVSDVLAVPTTGVVEEPAIANGSESPPSETTPEEPAPADGAVEPATYTAPGPRVTAPQPQALSAASTLALPRPTIPAPPVSSPPPEISARSTTAGVATPARDVPSVDPVPALTAAPPPRDESADVLAVLTRYETAYTQLNPAAAREVWPDVDERALSRAFSSLAAQRVSLGRCDVALNGGTARATCAGTASWTPKVGGGGARTEARRWTFDLRKAGEGWQIERATVR